MKTEGEETCKSVAMKKGFLVGVKVKSNKTPPRFEGHATVCGYNGGTLKQPQVNVKDSKGVKYSCVVGSLIIINDEGKKEENSTHSIDKINYKPLSSAPDSLASYLESFNGELGARTSLAGQCFSLNRQSIQPLCVDEMTIRTSEIIPGSNVDASTEQALDRKLDVDNSAEDTKIVADEALFIDELVLLMKKFSVSHDRVIVLPKDVKPIEFDKMQ
jgi:hypothetical protein